MAVPDELRRKLSAFDHKSFSMLTEVAAAFGRARTYPGALVDLAADPDGAVSAGATWLIKHHAEAGEPLSPAQCRRLAARLGKITSWDAQLHICQSTRLLPYPAKEISVLYNWALPLLGHERPFVRAWALDLICHLADRDDAYAPPAASALDRLARDPAASVRARVRNLSKPARS